MAGKYTVYDKYKETGIEWMGKVPEHWGVKSLKSILAERKEKNDPIKTKNILSLTMDKGVIPYSERDGGGNKAKEDISAYKLAYPNDIVLNSMNVVVGSVGLSKYFGAVSPVYYMLYPRKEEDKVEYFSQIFQSETFQRSLLGLGNGILMKESESSNKLNTIRMRIPMDKLNIQALPYPNAEEQQQIANFLDHETAKIDTLIEKQQQLIKLLKEKRQAITSNAITPQSGEKTTKLGHLIDLKSGYSFQSEQFSQDEEGIRLLRGINIGVGDCRWTETVYWTGVIDHKTLEFSLEKDDIVLGMDRPWISSGTRVAQIGQEDLPCLLVQRVARIRSRAGQNQSFIRLVLESNEFKSYLEADMTGVSVPHISPEQICGFPMRVLPQSQQYQIATQTEQKFLKLDALMSKANYAIDLLQERRTALISAVVTGKIDVRDWQAPND